MTVAAAVARCRRLRLRLGGSRSVSAAPAPSRRLPLRLRLAGSGSVSAAPAPSRQLRLRLGGSGSVSPAPAPSRRLRLRLGGSGSVSAAPAPSRRPVRNPRHWLIDRPADTNHLHLTTARAGIRLTADSEIGAPSIAARASGERRRTRGDLKFKSGPQARNPGRDNCMCRGGGT